MKARGRVIRHAVTIVGAALSDQWRLSLNDPSGARPRHTPMANVLRHYLGWGEWVETHLLNHGLSLGPPEGESARGIAVEHGGATLGAVRIPKYIAEPEDVVDGRTTEKARLAAFDVLADDASDHIVEEPVEGEGGGLLFGPLAEAILQFVPRYERRYGSSLRLLHLPGLFVTAIWLAPGDEREERIVPIYTLSTEVEIGHAYPIGDFERVLREPAMDHVREATLERDRDRRRGPDGFDRGDGPDGRGPERRR